MKKQAILFWIVIALAAFSILDGLFGRGRLDLGGLLIPLIVVGIVFLLYKFPPRQFRKSTPKVKPSARTMAKVAGERRQAGGKRKSYPFQVIEGQKGKNDDDLPKYH
ncbi:hypothetical protein J25TS5_06050 [Paenibacillus faecis]|uniref:DUF2207 domain-containing protein n=1 Tax=Paenibacillus faecis TaxID=862114 RepID=A0A5D0CT87_9BACL|nr:MULTISPECIES: hypothetical protein [Paenibacillus]MCA1295902.1 hypothetical protein [Paenibacillus sp. alder61]TYA13191.1 hypothetical protein FRY98_10995 [Paenibacillus faecis]GIO83673.1 hypothetical protein J25TS5_06050 [Paenibacillus faecis]